MISDRERQESPTTNLTVCATIGNPCIVRLRSFQTDRQQILGGILKSCTVLATVLGIYPAVAEDVPAEIPAIGAARVEQAPEINGLVDEALWDAIAPATGFIQQNPDEGALSTERTEVRIAFDDSNLYFGIICFDREPENIVVTQNRRDGSLIDTDSIQILIDSYNDGQNAFVFGTSPTGIEFDAQVTKAGQTRGSAGGPARAGGAGGGGAQRAGAAAFNLNWDAAWKVRSQVTERGWESEIAIPFRTLRYRPGTDQTWGLNISRNIRRRNELSFWSPVSRAFEFTQIEIAGKLHGIEARSHRNLKLLPYVISGFSQDFRLDEGRTERKFNGGLDLKYSLTPGLTLDGTINTDFAQVEVDDVQINLTRFDLFFPEKRPFFLENSGFFEFGTPREVEIFFSRRIGLDENRQQVPIDAGARMSGKMGKYQVGLLNMQTRDVEGRAPANNYAVGRVSRELPNRSSIGVIAVNRQTAGSFEGPRGYNRTFGADANIGIGKFGNWFNYVAGTQSPGLEGSSHAYSSRFDYDDATHRVSVSYLEVGENFNPEVGFVRRVRFRNPSASYRYTYYPKKGAWRTIEPHAFIQNWYTLGTNEKESGFEHYHFDSRLQNGGRLGLAYNRNFELLRRPFAVFPGIKVPEGAYQFGETIANFQSDPSAVAFGGGSVAKGNFYSGDITAFSLTGGVRKGQNLTWTLTWARNMIDLPVGAFNTDLASLRFNWSISTKSYFQTLSQYSNRTNQMSHNLRLGLLSTSATGLFVVYNTGMLMRDYIDPHSVERRLETHAFFIKFNYLLDY